MTNDYNKIKNSLRKLKHKIKKYPLLYAGISEVCIFYDRLMKRLEARRYKFVKEEDSINALKRGTQYSAKKCKEILNQNKADITKHIAFLITEYEEINNTGDKYSAISLGEKLRAVDPNLLISYYTRDPRIEWGNLHASIDYAIVMDPDTDYKIIAKQPSYKVAWVRGNYNKWMKNGYINRFDYILVSSQILKRRFEKEGLGTKVKGVIPLGIPIDVQRKLETKELLHDNRTKDVVFVGNIYDIEREIVKNLKLDNSFDFYFYGNIKAQNHKWNQYRQGCINHIDITSLYLDSKIIIEDIAPFNKGTVNLRVFEAAACGALVISNYDEALIELFGDNIEMYRTKDELNEKIIYYLKHDKARIEKAKQLQKIVLEKHTFSQEANKLYHYLYK